MADETKTLTTKQSRAIACLLTSANIQEAAAAAGVGERTLHTWLKEPAFQTALANEESRVIDAAARQLVQLSETAVGTLREILEDPSTPKSLRLRAAGQVLDNLLQLRQLVSLEDRVRKLEEASHAIT